MKSRTLTLKKLRITGNEEYFVIPSHLARKYDRVSFNGGTMILGKPFDRVKKYVNPTENKYFFFNYYLWKPDRTLFSKW